MTTLFLFVEKRLSLFSFVTTFDFFDVFFTHTVNQNWRCDKQGRVSSYNDTYQHREDKSTDRFTTKDEHD